MAGDKFNNDMGAHDGLDPNIAVGHGADRDLGDPQAANNATTERDADGHVGGPASGAGDFKHKDDKGHDGQSSQSGRHNNGNSHRDQFDNKSDKDKFDKSDKSPDSKKSGDGSDTDDDQGKSGQGKDEQKSPVDKAKDALKDKGRDALNKTPAGKAANLLLGNKDKDKKKKQDDKDKDKDNPVENAAKSLGKKVGKTAAMGGAKAAPTVVGLGIMQKFMQSVMGLLQMILGSQAASWIAGAISWIGGFFGGIGSAIGGAIGAIGSFIGGASAGVVAAITGGTIVTVATFAVLGSGLFMTRDNSFDCDVKAASGTISDVVGQATGGDWTEKGTDSYNNAQKLWDALKKNGLSGAAISGVIGNAAVENGGFYIIDRAEGHYGNDEKSAGIAYGNTPTTSAGYSYAVAGGGLFQFTPYTKFAAVGDKKWLDMQAQVDFMVNSYKSQGTSYGSGFKAFGHSTDPGQAAVTFQKEYERGAADAQSATMQLRMANAKKAYELFGGSSVNADDSLLGTGGGGAADANTATANTADNKDCGTSSSSDVADGTGSVSEKATAASPLRWNRDDVPSDVTQYIHNPEDVGMSFGSATGWYNPGGQCVNFASSYFQQIWGLAPRELWGVNGIDTASGWAKLLSQATSTEPHAGAIASLPGGVTGISTPGPYGHTFVVLHVLANGDLIYVEQNMPAYGTFKGSGDNVGSPDTWNFGLMAKASYDGKATFFTPKSPYSLKWTSK